MKRNKFLAPFGEFLLEASEVFLFGSLCLAILKVTLNAINAN